VAPCCAAMAGGGGGKDDGAGSGGTCRALVWASKTKACPWTRADDNGTRETVVHCGTLLELARGIDG
jgi:hypothetical protein